MGYSIYHVRYETGWAANEEAIIATNSKEKIPIFAEEHARRNPRINAISRNAKDISFRVIGFADTGSKADKEGVIGYSSKELDNRIKFKGKTLILSDDLDYLKIQKE
jgi:hypothetical protein